MSLRPSGVDPDRDGVFDYVGSAIDPDTGVELSWELNGGAGPFVGGSIAVLNTQAITADFSLLLIQPILPLPAGTELAGSAALGLTTDSGGGTVATVSGIPLWRAFIDGTAVGPSASLFADPFAATIPRLGSLGFSESFGIPDRITGPAVQNTIGIALRFTLTPLDQVSVTSVFSVASPAPATAGSSRPLDGGRSFAIEPAQVTDREVVISNGTAGPSGCGRPFVTGAINVINTSSITLAFQFLFTVPIVTPITSPMARGSVVGTVTDLTGDDATVSAPMGGSIYVARIDGVDEPGSVLMAAPFSQNAGGPLLSETIGPFDFGIPSPISASQDVDATISVSISFNLTAGDSASFTSIFEVFQVCGACCLSGPGGGDGGCVDTVLVDENDDEFPVTEANCERFGGTFQGGGSTCATATDCPSGACCTGVNALGGGLCYDVAPFDPNVKMTEALCESSTLEGEFQGDGSVCGPDSCEGACCRPNLSGGGTCSEGVLAGLCREFNDQFFLGIGSTCDGVVCPYGACCLFGGNGGCVDTALFDDEEEGHVPVTQENCVRLGGTYQGDGSECATATDCPTGACCTGAGPTQGGGLCYESLPSDPGVKMTEGLCTSSLIDGTYRGDGSICDASNSCRGACCDDCDCTIQFLGICESFGRVYQGDNTLCTRETCDDEAPTAMCDATRDEFEVDASCETFVTFTATITDNCCVDLASIVLGISAIGDSATVGFIPAQNCLVAYTTPGDTTRVGIECSAKVEDLTSCPATIEFRVSATDCAGIPLAVDCVATTMVVDPISPQIVTCPEPISVERGDLFCTDEVVNWLATFEATDNCMSLIKSHNGGNCGFLPGTTEVTFTADDGCSEPATCTSSITVAPFDRVTFDQKGSLLIFSKIEIQWDEAGNVIQDTFLDVANDYPGAVTVQAYFINGDINVPELRDESGQVVQEFEPGWNTADCRFSLTPNQPHFWSAATGSDKCQPFTVLDSDGPGRLNPETSDGSRILRGYVVMWAVRFNIGGNYFEEIRWNHLKGDAVIVNYANGTAWEYNAWSASAKCGGHGQPLLDCVAHDEAGACCEAAIVPGRLDLDGFQYDIAFDTLLLDFYGTGSTVLSGGGVTATVDTDLTVHAVDVDLRQDGRGPVLTKVEAEIWNELESKFSGTRRCICCWDQTMLSDWVRSAAIPNHFRRSALRTDKGKARLDGVCSDECDYEEICGRPFFNAPAFNCNGRPTTSRHTPLLGLATKFIGFSGTSMDQATAGMNLVGTGTEAGSIIIDVSDEGEELKEPTTDREGGLRAD